MWLDDYFSKHLKEGEEPIRVVRRYGLTVVPALVVSGLAVLVDFFLLAWWIQWRGWGLVGFGIVMVIALAWGARAIYVWSRNVLILTSHRIIDIDQHGWWHRTVAEAPYQKIQDVRYTTRGIWETMFHFGTVIIQTAGNTTNLELTRVHDPMHLQQQITDLQQTVDTKAGDRTSLSSAIDALRNALGPQPTDGSEQFDQKKIDDA